jgi:hypothetical protein
MIRCINQLVPFGVQKPRDVSTLLIGNIGRDEIGYSYLVLYDEPESEFSKGIQKFKVISGYDRHAPLFNLMTKVYQEGGWLSKEELPKFSDDIEVLLYRLKQIKVNAHI